METLKLYSIKLIKLHVSSTLPFYISSYRHDMIISEYLFEKPNSKLCTII